MANSITNKPEDRSGAMGLTSHSRITHINPTPADRVRFDHEQRKLFVRSNRSTNDWWQRGVSTLDKFCRDNAVELDRMMHEVQYGNGGHGK